MSFNINPKIHINKKKKIRRCAFTFKAIKILYRLSVAIREQSGLIETNEIKSGDPQRRFVFSKLKYGFLRIKSNEKKRRKKKKKKPIDSLPFYEVIVDNKDFLSTKMKT